MAPYPDDLPQSGGADDNDAETIDYAGDEAYLRSLGYPEDAWLFSGQKWYRTAEVAEEMAISEDTVNRLAEAGHIPGAVLHGELGSGSRRRTGWRLPRSGLIVYMARRRREQAQGRGRSFAG